MLITTCSNRSWGGTVRTCNFLINSQFPVVATSERLGTVEGNRPTYKEGSTPTRSVSSTPGSRTFPRTCPAPVSWQQLGGEV
jgi:hypothetical protein